LAAVDAIKFGLDPTIIKRIKSKRSSESIERSSTVSLEMKNTVQKSQKPIRKVCNDEVCEMCSA
jgi:hypothetical protein